MDWRGPLGLLDAAYRLDGTDEEWMDGLVEAMSDVFPDEPLAVTGGAVRGMVDASGFTVVARLENVHARGAAIRSPELLARDHARQLPPPELQQQLYFAGPRASTVSEVTGLGAHVDDLACWSNNAGWDAGALKDALGLTFHGAGLTAGFLSVGLRKTTTLTARERRLGERLAVHLGASFRLRSSLVATPARADAVLTPAGRIEHLADDAPAAAVAEGFARRRLARAHGVTPESALEIWQGLHDGRWSMVDYIDADRKAFVLAVRNEPGRQVATALTDRQRAAVALAALGYSNKQIAYALGLSPTAAAMLLARARATTGVRTRADLVRAFKRTLAEAR